MNNQANTSFQSFAGSICKLDHAPAKPSCCSTSVEKFNGSTGEGKLSSAFDPFQEKLSQQYSLSGQDTSKMLLEFVDMLTEVLMNVKNSFEAKPNQAESTEADNALVSESSQSGESESCSAGCSYAGS